jgi:hypothetical protein
MLRYVHIHECILAVFSFSGLGLRGGAELGHRVCWRRGLRCRGVTHGCGWLWDYRVRRDTVELRHVGGRKGGGPRTYEVYVWGLSANLR